MKQRSLKTKLLLLTLGLFLASGVAMTLMQSASLNTLRNDIMTQTRGALEQEVSRTLQFQAERYAVQIADLLQQSYQIPLGIAAQLEDGMAQPELMPAARRWSCCLAAACVRLRGSAPSMPSSNPTAMTGRMPAGRRGQHTRSRARAAWRCTSPGSRMARLRSSR